MNLYAPFNALGGTYRKQQHSLVHHSCNTLAAADSAVLKLPFNTTLVFACTYENEIKAA